MRRWIVLPMLALAGVVAAVAVVGLMLPQAHRAQRTVRLARPPGEVFDVIAGFERYPEWRTDVGRVRVEGAGVGARVFEESGGETMVYQIDVFEPPSRLVMRIADASLPFGGTWTYELRPIADGTELTVTEDGEVYNPIFRFVSRFILGHYATIDGVLTDARKALR